MAKRNLMNDLIWRKNSFNTHIYLCTDLCFAAPFFDGFSMSGQHAKIEKRTKRFIRGSKNNGYIFWPYVQTSYIISCFQLV